MRTLGLGIGLTLGIARARQYPPRGPITWATDAITWGVDEITWGDLPEED